MTPDHNANISPNVDPNNTTLSTIKSSCQYRSILPHLLFSFLFADNDGVRDIDGGITGNVSSRSWDRRGVLVERVLDLLTKSP